jgi:hypothetical protein
MRYADLSSVKLRDATNLDPGARAVAGITAAIQKPIIALYMIGRTVEVQRWESAEP